ncbi:ADP-ribose pyrophosphatase [Formivibrio citricus]|uniref:GDP-mannose pyrophosphatase n=1 Tax=Formivibrio citricus TaxID=83765 RepID=A0A1I4WK43_9NEIS|nr:NUDIX hydrolase [Formivibrio citricus]SFN13835.1 ADP-ribose pyrophosphatase [Formivibrio citricus]
MSNDSHLIEETLDSRRVFDGNLLHINCDRVRLPDGGQVDREYVVHPGAVMILPVLDDGRLLMERQYRYPLKQVVVEFPAGKIDPGEDTLACAQRELQEETGYSASEWEYLGAFHPLVSYSDEIIHIYRARGLTAGATNLDEEEFVEIVPMSLDQLKAGILDGSMTDAKTITGVFWLLNR